MNSAGQLMPATPLGRWWAEKTDVERRIVLALVAFVVLVLGWWGLWLPLVGDLAAMRADAPASRAALAEAHRMADEMASLSRMPPAPAADARAVLEQTLVGANLRQAVTQIEWKEGRARVVFAGVDFARLVAATETLQRESGLVIVEATLTARVEPGTVRAELVLAR